MIAAIKAGDAAAAEHIALTGTRRRWPDSMRLPIIAAPGFW
jgi:hypothetical protein